MQVFGPKRALRAVTLIELVIAVVIAGFIASIAVVAFSAADEDSEAKAAQSYALSVINAQISASPRNLGFTDNPAALGLRPANVAAVGGIADERREVSMAVSEGKLGISAWVSEGVCLETVLSSVSDADYEFQRVEGFTCDARVIFSS
jgi:prepilin-type N-terminal cleavage/methylation domain-containing protein